MKNPLRIQSVPFQTRPQKGWFWFCAVCLSVYLSAALYLCRSGLFLSTLQTMIAVLLFVLFAAVALGALLLISVCPLPLLARGTRAKLNGTVFLAAAGLSLLLLGVFVAADYPGGVSVDSAVQWTQASTNTYSNWHPVFHTLLLRLGYMIRPNYGVVVALQCGVFSLAMGYLIAVLYAWGVKLWVLLPVQAIVIMSPIIGNTMMYLWKDNAMTIGVTLLFAHGVNLYYSRGQWLKRLPNAIAFGVTLAFTTMVRHNAFFFTLPLLFTAILCYRIRWKPLLVTAAAFIACLALVWGPLYGALNVTYPNNTLEESIGVPMTVISDIRKQNPGALDGETRAFTDAMADVQGWERYQLHVYNSIKFGQTRQAVSRVEMVDILRMTLNTAHGDPRTAFLAVCGVTDLVWGLADEGDALIAVRNSRDLPGVPVMDRRINRIGKAIKTVITKPFDVFPLRYLFGNIGVTFLLMLIAALWAIRQSGTAALLIALPVLLYNLATMIVLCGKDARFFAFSPLVCLFSLFILLRKLPDENEVPA